MRLRIQNTMYFDTDWEVQTNQNIEIENEKIKKIVPYKKEEIKESDEVIDGRNLLWMPGLVDAHCHVSQQFLRGRLLDERPLIYKRINVPFEASLSEEEIQLSTEFACCEMIKNGVTSFLDAGSRHAEVVYETLQQIGMRAGISYQTTDGENAPPSLRTNVKEALQRNEQLVAKIQKEDSLVSYFNSITAPTACSDALLIEMFRQAKELDIPYELHTNEYASEVTSFIETHGIRPIEFLEKEQLLSDRLVASHGIYLNPTEMNLLQQYGVKVVHCPFSNCGKGIPETPALLDRKISVSLGSDGSGHGGIDMFAEMRLFRSLMNVTYGIKYGDYKIMPTRNILEMATTNGVAKMLDSDLRGIQEGSTADLIALDCRNLNIYPTYRLQNTMVESVNGMCVSHTIVNGKLLMKDRKLTTIDEQKVREKSICFFEKIQKER